MSIAKPKPDAPGAVAPRRETRFAGKRMRFALIQSVGITTFLVLLLIVFSFLTSDFLTVSNFQTILSDAAFYGIVALGQTVVIIAGGFDLSVAGVAPLSAVLFGQLVNHGSPMPLAILAALAAGALVGLCNGLIVTKGGINPLITTLGMLSITGGLAFVVTQGLSTPITNVSAGFLASTPLLGLPNQVWVTAVALVLLTACLRYTTYGRAIYALGGNREASWLAGIRVDAVVTGTYILSGVFAAIGGVILASELLASDATLGNDAALISVAAVVLGGASLKGGVGGAPGTIVGILILETLADGLTLLHVSSFYQQIVTGLVLLLAVGFSQVRSRIVEPAA